jgi:HSP20 family protein
MSERSKRRSVFVVPFAAQGLGVTWQPAADIYRTPSGWLLKFELAGVTRDDVAIAICGSRITVAGVRRDWVMEECCAHYSMEIAYNRFERAIELPCDLANARLDIEFRDGILMVRVTTPGERP